MTTGVEELMQSLNHLVQSRQVLYLGISDTPAWFVVKANDYARHHGLRPFSVYQGKWSAAERDFERDIIPMCMDQGMALAPWGVLGGGYFKPSGKDDGQGRKMPSMAAKNAAGVSEVLEKIAERKGTLMTSVALAYVMHKSPYVFPIVGGRKVEHLKGNIEALGLKLTEADIEEIEGAYPFDIGFPLNFLGGSARPEDNSLNKRVGSFDYVKGPMPIEPADPGQVHSIRFPSVVEPSMLDATNAQLIATLLNACYYVLQQIASERPDAWIRLLTASTTKGQDHSLLTSTL